MAQWSEAALLTLEDVGVQVGILVWQFAFFFSFIAFLPFGFLLFIPTADPVSFARLLQKRISSLVPFVKPFHSFKLQSVLYSYCLTKGISHVCAPPWFESEEEQKFVYE